MENGKLVVPEVVELDLNVENLNVLVGEYEYLLNGDVDKYNRKKLGAAINICGQKRAIIEKARKREKAVALEYGKKVDSAAKEYFAIIDTIQVPLTEKRKEYDARIEAEKKAKEAAEHLADCIEEAYAINDKVNTDLAEIAELERKAKELEELRAKQEQEARDRQIAEDAAKLAREKAEQEKQAEIDRVKREKQAEIDQLKADQEAKENAQRERIEREKQEADEKARIKASKPDKEKLNSFLLDFELNIPPLPPFKSKEVQDIADRFIRNVETAVHVAKQSTVKKAR